jgi:hypothetical protein
MAEVRGMADGIKHAIETIGRVVKHVTLTGRVPHEQNRLRYVECREKLKGYSQRLEFLLKLSKISKLSSKAEKETIMKLMNYIEDGFTDRNPRVVSTDKVLLNFWKRQKTTNEPGKKTQNARQNAQQGRPNRGRPNQGRPNQGRQNQKQRTNSTGISNNNPFKNATSLKDLGSMYRKLSLKTHPNKGGSREQFQQMTKYKEELERKLRS